MQDWDQTERRKQARRQAERSGKYDRRRNRCGSCAHFSETDPAKPGWCDYHKGEIGYDDFACPMYTGQPD